MLGKHEMQKELALINQATGQAYSSTLEEKLFIEKFNEVVIGVQQFNNVRKRLRQAAQKSDEENRQAPTLSSKFMQKLQSILTEKINAFINNNRAQLLQKDFSHWEKQFESIIDESILSAWEEIFNANDKNNFSQTEREIYLASQEIANFNQYFLQMIRSKINFDNIRHILENSQIKIKNRKKTGVSSTLGGRKGLNLENRRKVATVGGSVQEFIETVMSQMGQAFQAAASTGSKVASTEILKTDTMTLFSFEQNIDAQAIIDELDKQLLPSKSLLDAVSIMDSFWNENLSKLSNKNFILYGSTKAYSLKQGGGFHAGGKRSLEDAKAILQQVGYDESKVNNFINAAYNTGQGAIFEDAQEEFIEQIKISLSKAVANLIFDDWSTLGQIPTGAQAIHVLQLDALQVPLSVFLMAAGRAILNTAQLPTDYIHISVKLPGAVKYQNEKDFSGKEQEEIIKMWNEQAALAKSQSNFLLTFLKNFKDLIIQWLEY